MICDANVDSGSEDPMFHVLGRNFDNFVSLGYCIGYNTSLDPSCMYVVDALRKIIWNTFFDFSFDFSIALGLVKRVLTLFIVVILKLSCFHACQFHVVALDKLPHALMESDLLSRVLKL